MNWTLLSNSILLAVGATVLCVFLGSLAALGLRSFGRKILQMGLMASAAVLILPAFLVANCWIFYFGNSGKWAGLLPFKLYSFAGTLWLLVMLYWPMSTLLVVNALHRIPEASLDLEPKLVGRHLFRWVILPEIAKAMKVAGLLTFVLALNNFSIPALLQVPVYSSEIWVQFNTFYSFQGALVTALPFVVLTVILVHLLKVDVRAFTRSGVAPIEGGQLGKRLGAGFTIPGAVTFVMLLSGSFLLPLAQLMGNFAGFPQLIRTARASLDAIFFTFLLAIVCSAAVLLISWFARSRKLDPILWSFFVIPGVLLGISCIWLFNRPGLAMIYGSPILVFGLYAVRYLAVGKTGVASIVSTSEPALDDLSRQIGLKGWRRITTLVLPQHGPALVACGYLVYALILWDVETMLMIVPAGTETVALRVFNLLHYGHTPQVDGLCLILLGMGILPLGLAMLGRIVLRPLYLTAVLSMGVMITGCQPQPSGETSLESKIFGSVKILGDRGNGVGQFNKPRSIALDREDNLFVVDITGRVQKFSPDGQYLLGWQMPQTDQGRPKGMCRDPYGNVLLVEPHYSRVNQFDANGKLLSQWGKHGTNWGDLIFPRAVAVNSAGNVFISEYGVVERIQVFDLESKQILKSFGTAGTGPGQFNRPEGLFVDFKNRLLVCDSCNHRVQIFSPDGNFERTFASAGNGPGELSYPYDIQTDRDGLIYVCEFGNSRIQVFDKEGKSLEIIGRSGRWPGEFNNPMGIALDSIGNLYVADSVNHRIQKLIRRNPLQKMERNSNAPLLPPGAVAAAKHLRDRSE